jgi:L-fuculose-phosphate aldolase/L-ribulose-5-phosphate 4-epimerase
MDTYTMKKTVLTYAQKAFAANLMAGTSGNLSVSDGSIMAITPSGADYMSMSVDDIVLTDLNGNVLDGLLKPSSEWRLHAEIYRHKPEVRAVVHTHSPYATAFAVLNQPIPVILIEAAYSFRGDVRIAPVAKQGSLDVGIGAVAALRDRGVCLLQNHGAVAVGGDMEKAFIRAVYLEDIAKVYHLSRAIGAPTVVPDELVEEMLSRPH